MYAMVLLFAGSVAACPPVSPQMLGQILGPAYNSRYMSVEPPPEIPTEGNKRNPLGDRFYVEEEYTRELDAAPAWRPKRSARQWQCESRIRWLDLGPDYFPRYLRSVECTTRTCWYDMFECRARSFTVRLLRRRRGRCATKTTGTLGLPAELRELWLWEERAITFCCDCSAPRT